MYRDKVKGHSHTVTLHTPVTAGAGTNGLTSLPRTGSKEATHQEHGDVMTGGATDVHHKPHRCGGGVFDMHCLGYCMFTQ